MFSRICVGTQRFLAAKRFVNPSFAGVCSEFDNGNLGPLGTDSYPRKRHDACLQEFKLTFYSAMFTHRVLHTIWRIWSTESGVQIVWSLAGTRSRYILSSAFSCGHSTVEIRRMPFSTDALRTSKRYPRTVSDGKILSSGLLHVFAAN